MRRIASLTAFGLCLGWTAVSTAQPLTIVSNQPGTFVDISMTGTDLNLNDDAEGVIPNPGIGNAVFPVGDVVVGNNGGVAFPSVIGQNDLAALNAPIPSASAFNGRQSLLPFWDDLKGDDLPPLRGGKNGSVRWQVISTVLYIQWSDRPIVTGASVGVPDTVTFQLQIFGGVTEAPGAIYAQLLYTDIEDPLPNGGASATIGYQNGASDSNNVQWSFNTAGAVSNGTVLSLIQADSIPAVSDAGNVAMVLLFLTVGVFVFRRGRMLTLNR